MEDTSTNRENTAYCLRGNLWSKINDICASRAGLVVALLVIKRRKPRWMMNERAIAVWSKIVKGSQRVCGNQTCN